MHFEPPPQNCLNWAEYSTLVPHARPYAFTCYFTPEPTNDDRYRWYFGWAPSTPIWDLENKQWIPPMAEIPNDNTGAKAQLYDSTKHKAIPGGEWFDSHLFHLLPIGSGYWGSYEPLPKSDSLRAEIWKGNVNLLTHSSHGLRRTIQGPMVYQVTVTIRCLSMRISMRESAQSVLNLLLYGASPLPIWTHYTPPKPT